MRQQVTRGMIEAALRELEIRIGTKSHILQLCKTSGRGGWHVRIYPSGNILGPDVDREARDMLSTLQFANTALHWRAIAERNGGIGTP